MNPYVGPRAFRASDAASFFARGREQRDLADLLTAERVVLLHAPSGAGKTSLIQAGLVPLLVKRRFRPTSAARVKTPPPSGAEVRNRYVRSVAMDVLEGDRDAEELAGITFADIFAELKPRAGEGHLVLILDQFEELLSIDPTDWKNQTAFFRELGNALQEGDIWTLISMREDYVGGLDRFLRYMPDHLRNTYRLDYLSRSAAMVAIREPAAKLRVDFAKDAAENLVAKLGKVLVAHPCGGPQEVDAPYVQPFQLQVVCRRLWKVVAKSEGEDFKAIELRHVRDHAHIPEALARYYAGAVAEVASASGADERAIRRWFERELITKDRLRTQTLVGPKVQEAANPTAVLGLLSDARLIRSDTRGDSTWWELSHDTLIAAVLSDNQKWLRGRLLPWQLAAHAWAEDRQRASLLTGPDLREAERTAHSLKLTDNERQFLEESVNAEKAERDRGTLAQLASVVANLRFIVLAEAILILVLLLVLFLN